MQKSKAPEPLEESKKDTSNADDSNKDDFERVPSKKRAQCDQKQENTD